MYFDEKIGEICSFGPVLCFRLFCLNLLICTSKSNIFFLSPQITVFAVRGGGSERYGPVRNFF